MGVKYGRWVDHKGNEYSSKKELCDAYGLEVTTFNGRQQHGWTMQRILTTPVRKLANRCKDHKGNEYTSESEMCKAYGVQFSTYRGRLDRGYTLEEALTRKSFEKGDNVVDHEGNKYKNIAEMCRAYKLDRNVYEVRKQKGWNLRDILMTPDTVNKGNNSSIHYGAECMDHLGNIFHSIKDMCAYHGITVNTYNYRANQGLSLKEIFSKDI